MSCHKAYPPCRGRYLLKLPSGGEGGIGEAFRSRKRSGQGSATRVALFTVQSLGNSVRVFQTLFARMAKACAKAYVIARGYILLICVVYSSTEV